MKRPVNMYGPLGLDGKSITNLEGAQFLVNAGTISLANNQVTSVAPLADLNKVKVLTLSRNRIADVTPLAQISSLETLALELNQTLTSIAPLATAPKLKELNITSTKVGDLTPLASVSTLEKLHMRNLLISPAKISLAPLASHPKLAFIDANTNRLTGSDLAVMKNAPVLETLMAAGNNILNLQDFLNSGFATLHQSSTFSAQLHAINTGNNPLIANPVRGINGEVVAVTETATVKNADADGTLNPNGAYIKLVDTYGNGTVNVAWTNNFSYNNIVNREFSGTIAVRYTLPPRDTVAPTFSPAAPAKITSRKGVAININDVTATDNPGGSGISPNGVTNDVAAINLDVSNPAPGNYTLMYSVEDNHHNSAYVYRDIEITDADDLQSKVNTVTDTSLNGYTAETVDSVKSKRQAAQLVINNNSASQSQIDQSLNELNNALAGLVVDNAPITIVIRDEYDSAPDYIKNDAGVDEAYRQANLKMNDANRTPAEVAQAAQNLHAAIEAAVNAETARQTVATNAVIAAETNLNPVYFEAAQNAINSVLDPIVKQQLQARLDTVRDAYQAKRNELNALIAKVELPETTDGMTSATVAALQNELAQAKAANVPNIDQVTVQQLIDDLQAALDALRADKQPLLDAIALEATQPDYIKNNPAVVAALAEANTVNFQANPTVADVRARAQALRDAIAAAIQAETTAQNNAESALDATYDALNDQNLGPADMPNIDLVAIENKINAVQDPATKQDLIDDFNQLKAALAARQAQVNAYIASQQSQNQGQNQGSQSGQTGSSSQNTASGERLSDTGESLALVAASGVIAVLGGVALLARKLRS